MAHDRIIFIFLDGCGIGEPDANNPFYLLKSPCLPFYRNRFPPAIAFDGKLKPIDCQLETEGEPQSATGQATLFSGINAAQYLGHHLAAFPSRALRELIYENNLFKTLRQHNKNPVFINAYPDKDDLFQRHTITLEASGDLHIPEGVTRRRRGISVTTTMLLANKIIPFGIRELIAGSAVYQDFTNTPLLPSFPDVPLRSAEEAAIIFANTSLQFDLTLFEYFQTDIFGHKKPMADCIDLVTQLARFIHTLLNNVNLNDTTILITSDHGNLEDKSSKIHTRNPVPFLVFGQHQNALLARVNSLVDVTPALIAISTNKP